MDYVWAFGKDNVTVLYMYMHAGKTLQAILFILGAEFTFKEVGSSNWNTQNKTNTNIPGEASLDIQPNFHGLLYLETLDKGK